MKFDHHTSPTRNAMDEINMFRGQQGVLEDHVVLEELPAEILDLIRQGSSSKFLDAIATAAAMPRLTTRFFARFENVFADTCSRWIDGKQGKKEQDISVIQAFAQILPFAPHLDVYLRKYLSFQADDASGYTLRYLSDDSTSDILELTELGLQPILLAAYRLLNFDKSLYSKIISSTKIQNLLQHGSKAVRYLAVRILAQLLSASDAKLEEMIKAHVGKKDSILGDYDGTLIDYGFLSLYEGKRLKDVEAWRLEMQRPIEDEQVLRPQGLSRLVLQQGGVLLPRADGPPSRPSPLVSTQTTACNKEAFAEALLSPSPILIHGLSGSGKTSLVNDFARELGKESTMVTLHLNEQTDAKMLIGMYATDSTPGSFTWRAGVLTTAIKEGRWVFIEDLDRAPNEVISVILPLIERGELLIPSRGETIRAAPGFRLIASIRTSLNINGVENPPAMHMLGARLWNRVPVKMPTREEFSEIINGTHPILHKFLPGVISVYERLYTLGQNPSFASKSRTALGRPISPRDLLKWCRRMDAVLVAAGSKTGEEMISDATKDEMFMEAADCFASSLQTEDAKVAVITAIAEEMHIPPQRAQHYLDSHIPTLNDTDSKLQVGRVRISKRNTSSRVTKAKKRPFANTTHAKKLLEQVGVALKMAEPVLLVGETGIGKTTVIQQLADSLGYKLTAVNLSQQSEVGDLLGGFKPVNVRSLAIPLKEEFDDLFQATGISTSRNQKYLESIGKCVAKGQWTKASKLWKEAPKMFDTIVSNLEKSDAAKDREEVEGPSKRRKTISKLYQLQQLKPRWEHFSNSLDQFDVQLSGGSKGFAFTFVEGNIVKAARNGEWVLLDEINLASPDTLESIADLLHSGNGSKPSILLSETGEIERVQAHPNFRIFGAMNPATDVGKRDLPMGLRSRFTEIYVNSPDNDLDDLLAVIKVYLQGSSSNDERAAHDVARLYMNTKRLADQKQLVDGANQVPHFSLRTLTRVLSYVTETAPSYGLRRALYEGFAMGFLTLLNKESEQMLMPLINHHLLESHGNPQAMLAQTPRHPEDGRQYVRFVNKKRDRQYWMLQGREQPQEGTNYIITPFVERNLLNLVRATSTRKFPVLVQGPTSAGKTSMIEYLAKFSGNKFVRINNHEHTDLQEYLGTYVSGTDGQLKFQEGLLVHALREGHWIVLDELNLAPTDVLEALNRLLDDNRELLIPETQEIIRPHENFMLFATQNPPGLYGGRKTLSRAFRNRFLELHFDDIPEDELEYILENRAKNTAPSDCKRIVTVYKELSRLRQSNRLFEQKDSFATLRDLFRWALRGADNREQLAANGYMLLAERVRKAEERQAVKEIIEKVMKVKIDINELYSTTTSTEIQLHNQTANQQGVVWTGAMRRLYVLVSHALRHNEPVLLVGETGCGKTTVCQMLAEAFGKDLHIVNAHQNTETGDLIGAQRPVRNRGAVLSQLLEDLMAAYKGLGLEEVARGKDVDQLLEAVGSLADEQKSLIPAELKQRISDGQAKSKALFEWSDGSLVQAMRDGQYFLLDEISLADDSVLERLNSVLEPHRTMLLAEKGVTDSFVEATDGFQFFATMNPGGDYGKRELSPALRNRFTEIWVPSLSETADVLQIVESKLKPATKRFAKPMVDFAEWFGQKYKSSSTTQISVRDLLAWIQFVNGVQRNDPYYAILHGAAMVYIDTLGANPAALLAINPESIVEERASCLHQLSSFLGHDVSIIYYNRIEVLNQETSLFFGDFTIAKASTSSSDAAFAFDAPTTKMNAMRVVRALQVQKPILIEGSPGVGKTTLIAALAQAIGKPLTRINLSEQTDLMDLFGSDVPVEGAEAGNFAWRDAPFLQAMQRGDWVLLDEMNLASQSVLEGLNACLDHRGEVYISELDQTFKRHPNFSVFAAQNPHHQGGGRKGLPSSFVNRFTVVYADVFRNDDLTLICKRSFPDMDEAVMKNAITFVSTLEQEVVYKRRFGAQGGPWEFNLRDTLRWLKLLNSKDPLLRAGTPADFLNLIFRQRFRTPNDREAIDKLFAQVFNYEVPLRHLYPNLGPEAYQVGMAYLPRNAKVQRLALPMADMRQHFAELESVMMCVTQNMPCILVGPSGSGKSTIVQHVAAAAGAELVVFPLNADVDTMDLVGGFEQLDPQRASAALLSELENFLEEKVLSSLPEQVPAEAIMLLALVQAPENSQDYFVEIQEQLEALYQKTSLPGLAKFAARTQVFIDNPNTIESARFEWVDGVLVKALEEGKWLVLDNANLCSSSVLDRLNSLLEPNGFLSINEHCGPDGEPKMVRPHPNFRLFMTMDSRFGELSRAMRNRSIEIFLASSVVTEVKEEKAVPAVETSQQRFANFITAFESESNDARLGLLTKAALDHLSGSDMEMLPRFAQAVQSGLVDNTLMSEDTVKMFSHYLSALQSGNDQSLGEAIGQMYDTLAQEMKLPKSFRDSQTIHTLTNSPLVNVLQETTATEDQSHWLANVMELKVEVLENRDMAQKQANDLATLKPSQMNRLQRSMVRDRVPAVAKDSTASVASFLDWILTMVNAHLQEPKAAAAGWKVHARNLRAVMDFWAQTYQLALCTNFEEATFQAHLAIGNDLLAELMDACPSDVLTQFQKKLKSDFDSGFKLRTGLSMENLWIQFRPLPISNADRLAMLLEMEALANRFDALRWKISISVDELAGVMASLVKAYQILSTEDVDGRSLIETLSKELDTLEAGCDNEAEDVKPYLAKDFEALRQYKALEVTREKYLDLENYPQCLGPENIVLASHPTSSLMHLASGTDSSKALLTTDYLWGQGEGIQPVKDTFSAALIHRLHNAGDVTLNSLRLLEAELPIIGKQVVAATASLSRNHVKDMNAFLFTLMTDAVGAHGADLAVAFSAGSQELCDLQTSASFSQVAPNMLESVSFKTLTQSAACPAQLKKVLQESFIPAAISIAAVEKHEENQLAHSALAWINFAVGVLTLYVPDRAYDPDKRQRLERQRHIATQLKLREKLDALKAYEKILTGQNSNLRCQILEEQLAELGEPAGNLQEVFRPSESELDQLQGEFNNLLNTILAAKPAALLYAGLTGNSEESTQGLQLLQVNLVQIIRRFSERFRAYGDMTVPLVSMLRSLQIGISMAGLVTEAPTNNARNIMSLSKMTPFLGGDASLHHSTGAEQPLEVLAQVAITAAVEGTGNFDINHRQIIYNIFHTCFEQWSKRLEQDRLEQEEKGGLYHFKGSFEDEQEVDEAELNELFPAFDSEGNENKPVAGVIHHAARDTAMALAKLHSQIFLEEERPTEKIMTLIRDMSSRIGTMWADDASFYEEGKPSSNGLTGALLPGALLLLDDQIQALSADLVQSNKYNFYLSANLPEARKLVALIHEIMTRYQELQKVDEIGHMQPLEDVLVSCRELLKFRHTEPLAKIITKVEKVHTFMHEWQFGGWASRANSAIALYDRLTQTIISWRRLELSTWAKLFEMENDKCDDDAKSWWFIAYQVVVAAPLAISGSEEELRFYAPKLLKDLDTYFATAIQGQYAQRLQMLKQLQRHLAILAIDYPLMTIIENAVSNFIALYSRYEKPVVENLRRGRATLEKSTKEVLMLASWKDTNIVALRDSAKRSHHKLFKLVRKYRALLGQPMEAVLKQGLPEDSEDAAKSMVVMPSRQLPAVVKEALTICETHVPRWSEKSKRFVNVSKTVGRMDDAAQIPEAVLDVSEYLDSFLANVISTTAELQKTTPTVLTEENGETVKHLKNRKRRLFAETLKELREMGVKHNLGTSILESQDSLSMVLANTATLPESKDFDFSGIEYYYSHTLDVIPRARQATRGVNEDLSLAEVARSIGLIEGMFQIVIQQRNALAVAVADTNTLGQTIKKAENLWANGKYEIRNVVSTTTSANAVKWLPNILRVALELVNIHSKLGKETNKDVIDVLNLWIEKFDILFQEFKDRPLLPQGINSSIDMHLETEVEIATKGLTTNIMFLKTSNPGLNYILGQILPWTGITTDLSPQTTSNADIADLDKKMSRISDSVLVAIEMLAKSIATMPTSTEDPVWLANSDVALRNNIAYLYAPDITLQIQEAFEVVATLNLDDEVVRKTAGAVVAVVLPIIQQYYNTLQTSVARYAQLNWATCKMTYILSRSFIQIATQGFCTPAEKSDSMEGKTDKLEGGTGLGDGEGAEDISKDIQDDEDLSELAQEPNKGDKENEMEDEKDAVDMADGEMEGEMGEAEEKGSDDEGSGDEEDGEEEIDEEVGDVDDLDPNAIDEKMWDGDGEQAEKDQEGDQQKGKQDKDEQVASTENDKPAPEGADGEEDEPEEEVGAEQGEDVKQQDDVEKHDPHANAGDALDLPDDMDLDGDDDDEGEEMKNEEDDMDDLSDVDGDAKEGEEVDDGGDDKKDEGEDADGQEDQNMGDDMDVIDLDEKEDEDNEGEDTNVAGEKAEGEDPDQEPEEQRLLEDHEDDAMADPDNAVPSEAQGMGEDNEDNQQADDNKESASKSQREDGAGGGESSDQQDKSAEDGEKGRQAQGEAPTQSEDTQDAPEAQPFKKLGDALEKWHRQQTKIRDAPEEENQEKGQDTPMQNADDAQNEEFQHLQDEEAEEDHTQALGTATEEQAHALDESMAIDNESKDMPEEFQPDEVEEEKTGDQDDADVIELEDDAENAEQEATGEYEGRAGATIHQSREEREAERHIPQNNGGIEEEIEKVDREVEDLHLGDQDLVHLTRDTTSARRLWTEYENSTRDLSLSLTEQLRLILAPTLATKMRGDFRTGKRLNIKRIIPYIASSFKRDKIWMRRSVPSKRSYQIMLAVDDSKSMGESGSGSLAFETLAMVSKSLSMLEVGEICMVGFGENVKIAHDFDAPFSADAGPKVFQNFGFDQARTDVTKLIRESIAHFREARAKASSAPADLWQLELIISDGVCDSSEHEPIRRLLREAIEERIMIVFIIVDDVRNKKKGESVMDLKEAKFVKNEMTGNSEVKIERYLDTFPFQYYLVVGDVKELPGVLAQLLRQWFSEVAESSG